jgi:peptidoglycan/xylan/chitin deacetylase (PgdA/CDA1 family)
MAHRAGFCAFAAAVFLYFIAPGLSALPLILFVILCFGAPFLPRLSFFLPVICRGKTGKKAVSLTFDDGPDPVTTPALLKCLSRHNVKAAFFVTGQRASAHPELIRDILAQGHEIGNHTYHHDNLVMLKSPRRLMTEVRSAQRVLHQFGIVPRAFRPPVGITNPRLGRVLYQLGMINVNFSCRACDGGNRFIQNLSKRILKKIKWDDVIVLHDKRPPGTESLSLWLSEIDAILDGIQDKGFVVLPLSRLIDQPVMEYFQL